MVSTEGEPTPGIEPAEPFLVRIRSMNMFLTEGVRPAVFPVGAKARHRRCHRALLGSDSRFLSRAGCKRKKEAGGRWYSLCLVPKVHGAEDAGYRRCQVPHAEDPKVPKVPGAPKEIGAPKVP